MAKASNLTGRHPLCTCPTVKGAFGWPRIDYQPTCEYASIAHPRALSAEDVRTLVASYASRAEDL